MAYKDPEYHKKYYAENRDKILEYNRKYSKDNRKLCNSRLSRNRKKRAKWFQDLKSKFKCRECGENHPAALDFHHRDPLQKDDLVSRLVHSAASEERILTEIAKCDVLCAKCHRILHYNQQLGL